MVYGELLDMRKPRQVQATKRRESSNFRSDKWIENEVVGCQFQDAGHGDLSARIASTEVLWKQVAPVSPFTVVPIKSLLLAPGQSIELNPALFTIPASVKLLDLSGSVVWQWHTDGVPSSFSLSFHGIR